MADAQPQNSAVSQATAAGMNFSARSLMRTDILFALGMILNTLDHCLGNRTHAANG